MVGMLQLSAKEDSEHMKLDKVQFSRNFGGFSVDAVEFGLFKGHSLAHHNTCGKYDLHSAYDLPFQMAYTFENQQF